MKRRNKYGISKRSYWAKCPKCGGENKPDGMYGVICTECGYHNP